jgi:hypothetical protein
LEKHHLESPIQSGSFLLSTPNSGYLIRYGSRISTSTNCAQNSRIKPNAMERRWCSSLLGSHILSIHSLQKCSGRPLSLPQVTNEGSRFVSFKRQVGRCHKEGSSVPYRIRRPATTGAGRFPSGWPSNTGCAELFFSQCSPLSLCFTPSHVSPYLRTRIYAPQLRFHHGQRSQPVVYVFPRVIMTRTGHL